MRYLYIHCTSDLYGASRMMLRTISKQIQDGINVFVILPSFGPLVKKLENLGTKVIVIQTDPTLRKIYLKSPIKFFRLITYYCLSFIKFRNIAKKNFINLIITNTSQTLVGGPVARSLKIPHICHVRESYQEYGFLWKIYEKYLLFFSDLLICVSKSMMMQFNIATHNKKVCFVHDGFPKDEFLPVEEYRINEFKKKFSLEGYHLVGLVGRIIFQRKGQDIFVKSAKELENKVKNVKYLIIGSCYPGNEYHLKNLIKLIDKLNIKDYVILTGEVDDIKAVYASLDISIMASAKPEPFGGVTIESMAYGKPVIGTNIGGTPEQIIHNHSGILIPPNDPKSMAEAIFKLLEDSILRKEIGENAKHRFNQFFGFDEYYEKLMKYYNNI